MRISRKRLLWTALALLAIGAAFLIFPPYYQYCDSDYANDKYCAAYSVVVALGTFVDSHNGAVTAIATVFIGLFTYTLKRSTDKMWDAGERQIKTTRQVAAIQARQMRDSIRAAEQQVEITKIGIFDLERAYLSVGPTQINTDFIPRQNVAFYNPNDPQRVTVKLSVHNTGRTGAAIKKVYGEFSRKAPIGDTPIYINGASKITDVSISADKEAVLEPFIFTDNFTGPQFFWGYVEYLDIFNRPHTARFCTSIVPAERMKPGTGQFDIAGSDGWRKDD